MRIPAIIAPIIVFTACALSLHGSEQDRFIDRFGKPVEATAARHHKFGDNVQAKTEECRAGHFLVEFIENPDEPASGFFDLSPGVIASDAHPFLGDERRAVLCAVLEDLSELLVRPANTDPVRIRAYAYRDGSNTAARATAVYRVPGAAAGGYLDGAVWQTLNTGRDAFTGFVYAPSYHGYVEVNFAQNFNIDIDAAGFSGVDLYTVLLHEILHALGFASFIRPDGSSAAGLGYFTRYDAYLYSAGNNDTLALITNPDDCYSTGFNAALSPDVLLHDCKGGSSSIIFKGQNLPIAPVFAPANWQDGSSLSHFHEECSAGHSYVMDEQIASGAAKRTLHPDEVAALCDLGYTISGTYGKAENPGRYRNDYSGCQSVQVAGTNDIISASGQQETPVRIAFADLANNDINTQEIRCLEVIGGAAKGVLSRTDLRAGDTVDFVTAPGVFGSVVLRYVPFDHNRSGNTTYVFLGLAYPPLPPCPENTCNLLCNGDFELTFVSGKLGRGFSHCYPYPKFTRRWLPWGSADIVTPVNSESFSIPPSWDVDTENVYFSALAQADDQHATDGEGMYQKLKTPLLNDGTLYMIQMYVYLEANSAQQNSIPDLEIFLDTLAPCIFPDSPLVPGSQRLKFQTPPVSNNKWNTVVFGPFSVDFPYSWFFIKTNSYESLPGTNLFFFVDDIQLIPFEAYLPFTVKCHVSDPEPCFGTEITYTVSLCLDNPDSAIDVSLRNILPDGLTYTGGDFRLEGGELVADVPKGAFDTAQCIHLRFTARVDKRPDLAGQRLTNAVYVGNAECRQAVADIVPRFSPLSLEKSVSACRVNGVFTKLELCNTAPAPQDSIVVYEELPPGSTVLNAVVRMGGREIRTWSQNGTSLEFAPLTLPATVPHVSGDPVCVTIEYRATAPTSGASFNAVTTVASLTDACTINSISTVPIHEPVLDLGPDRALCGTTTLDAGPDHAAYRWNTGASTATLTLDDASASGLYWVEVRDENGCIGRDSVFIESPTGQRAYLEPAFIEAEPNERFTLELRLDAPGAVNIARNWQCRLRFNATLLHPLNIPGGCTFVGSECILDLSGTRSAAFNGETLARIEFLALLGNDYRTPISIEDFRWTDCEHTIAADTAEFVTANTCEGAQRLISIDGRLALHAARPNPAGGTTEIEFELIEHGRTRILLVDALGRTVRTLVDTQAQPGRYVTQLVTSGIPSGMYTCVLQTPHRVLTQRLQVLQ